MQMSVTHPALVSQKYKSSLHRVLTTKSVKESEETSYILLQSSKSSFHKMQIFSLQKWGFSDLSAQTLYSKTITELSFIYKKCYRIGRNKLHIVTYGIVSTCNIQYHIEKDKNIMYAVFIKKKGLHEVVHMYKPYHA